MDKSLYDTLMLIFTLVGAIFSGMSAFKDPVIKTDNNNPPEKESEMNVADLLEGQNLKLSRFRYDGFVLLKPSLHIILLVVVPCLNIIYNLVWSSVSKMFVFNIAISTGLTFSFFIVRYLLLIITTVDLRAHQISSDLLRVITVIVGKISGK